jgi:tetratricopeptide (TPR) repeat protein
MGFPLHSRAIGLVFWLAVLAPMVSGAARGCEAPPALLTQAPEKILAGLGQNPAPYLAAADGYSIGMEACYDSAFGPLELAPFVRQASQVSDTMAALRKLAEENVRHNELSFEALLSSDLWGDIEALRVAGAYGLAWGQLAAAVRHISAQEKAQAMRVALRAMQGLTFEFKHPVLVQRAMYGLATTQIEAGDLPTAISTLQRLQQSLKRGGAPSFVSAVDDFYARIRSPDYRPPVALFDTQKPPPTAPSSSPIASGDALSLARQAMRETRSADEIIALLRPVFQGGGDSLTAALDIVARDQLLLDAMDYEPGLSLRVMRRAFASQKYGQIVSAWAGVKPFHSYMPVGLKRRVDYHMGVARLNLGEYKRAVAHLWAARDGLPEASATAARLNKLIALAQLSFDKTPDAAMITLARAFQDVAIPNQTVSSDTVVAPPALDVLLAMRARVVLARDATARKRWAEADKILTGIGPGTAAYPLFLGMRVRLLAQAIKARRKQESPAELAATARGAMTLYQLWTRVECPPGCIAGNQLAVHRAGIEIALSADLSSPKFGAAWGSFVEAGGDVRPLVPRALAYLVAQNDSERLTALLEAPDEASAAYLLAHWKAYLRLPQTQARLGATYGWLTQELETLQGRPRAVLLETLIDFDLARNQPEAALPLAEKLASEFPRRPSAWFLRAATLQANARGIEAARALSSLARRTPADDPVGMGARLGLAAIFIELERKDQACAMQTKIFSRTQAQANWKEALTAFPILQNWQKIMQKTCG